MIKISKLSFSIKQKAILKDINLLIPQGQYFALAGVNGAGKSTFIKLMLDLLRSTNKNSVLLNEKSSWSVNNRAFLSYLPEKFQVNKTVTGARYLQFVAGIYQSTFNEGLIKKLCDQLDFKHDDLKKNVTQYSKGMMQKLGLISNFMLEKPLMILDEPLSGLDPKARYCLKQLLLKKKQQGITVFYSTHMLADAEEVCDQFGILDEGYLKFVGTPEACRQQYSASTLEAAYMNCIR